MDLLTDPNAWLAFAVLALMEIVLGIDNIVFITILTGRLPPDSQLGARRMGIGVALLSRLLLLSLVSWIAHLKHPLFTLVKPWSGKDLILFGGGLFLLYKATREIYENVEHPGGDDARDAHAMGGAVRLAPLLAQVFLLDVVFSLDSVITAVGMAEDLRVMAAAVIAAVLVMLAFAGPVGDFVNDNPSVRVLALAFLVLIGATLVMEATGAHVSKGYIYSAMGFSLAVQILNMRMDTRRRGEA
ncbi:MAG: TerC family protein [Alphaproteobacteria bacterium]|nr:TerC family protein [Alphaproteobacteria bacterium]